MKLISLRIDYEMHQAAKKLAVSMKMSFNTFVLVLIQKALRDEGVDLRMSVPKQAKIPTEFVKIKDDDWEERIKQATIRNIVSSRDKSISESSSETPLHQ